MSDVLPSLPAAISSRLLDDGSWELRFPWSRRLALTNIGVAIVTVLISLSYRSTDEGWGSSLGTFFALLFGAAGLVTSVPLLLNKTVVKVRRGYLEILTRPIPTRRAFTATVPEIDQFVVVSTQFRNDVRHTLSVRLHDGSKKALLSTRQMDEGQLRQLEITLEQRLGITDDPSLDG